MKLFSAHAMPINVVGTCQPNSGMTAGDGKISDETASMDPNDMSKYSMEPCPIEPD